MRWPLLLAFAALVAWVPAAASAEECPLGSYRETSPQGPYCSPSTCAKDADCKSFLRGKDARKLACKMAPLCVGQKTIRHPRAAASQNVPFATECGPTCGIDKTTTCEVFLRCVPEGSDPLEPKGCSCALGGAGAGGFAALGAALCLLVGRRWRRRRVVKGDGGVAVTPARPGDEPAHDRRPIA